METPTKIIIKEALEAEDGQTIDEIKARTHLSTVILYGTILVMEDTGELQYDPLAPAASRRYHLAPEVPQGTC